MDDDSTVIGITKNGEVITEATVDCIVADLFSKVAAGEAIVESRPRDYYGVTIPLGELPEELREAVSLNSPRS